MNDILKRMRVLEDTLESNRLLEILTAIRSRAVLLDIFDNHPYLQGISWDKEHNVRSLWVKLPTKDEFVEFLEKLYTNGRRFPSYYEEQMDGEGEMSEQNLNTLCEIYKEFLTECYKDYSAGYWHLWVCNSWYRSDCSLEVLEELMGKVQEALTQTLFTYSENEYRECLKEIVITD